MITTIAATLGISQKAAKIGILVAAAMAMALVLGLTYFQGKSAGKSAMKAEYAQKVLEAAQVAREASETATANKDTRDDEFVLQQQEIEDAVTEAIDNGGDGVSAYFDQLRCNSGGGCEAASE